MIPNCTVVITTYNRPAYLKRILDYFKANGVGLEFIIIDSSSAKNQVFNQGTVDFYNNREGVKFTRYSYVESTKLWEKWSDGMSRVKTKYCVLCAEDDFIVPQAIKKSVNFLENNPDFSVVLGKYLSFHVRDRNSSSPKFCWQNMYSHSSVVSDDAKNRLTDHFINYNPTTYAVHRASFLRTVFYENIKTGIDLFLFGELMPSLLTLIHGKMKILDILYSARQEDVSYGVKWPTFDMAEKEGRYQGEYEKFRACLTNHLAKASPDCSNAVVIIDDAMKKYRQKAMPPEYRKNIAKKAVELAAKVNTPPRLYNFSKLIYRFFFPLRRDNCGIDLSDTELQDSNKDFLEIRDSVMAHPSI
ncbi:MAG: TIGR00180 family glycosyltransferase [bacterium]|nr:TIGR00180 family glycosyltransferase [bacterium]